VLRRFGMAYYLLPALPFAAVPLADPVARHRVRGAMDLRALHRGLASLTQRSLIAASSTPTALAPGDAREVAPHVPAGGERRLGSRALGPWPTLATARPTRRRPTPGRGRQLAPAQIRWLSCRDWRACAHSAH